MFNKFLNSLRRTENASLIETIQKGYQTLFEAVGRNIMYHGTHKRNLRSVLKQGLIPNPKQREWQDDTDVGPSQLSRQSYEGIYLTENLMTATGSAGRRSQNQSKEKEKIVVVVDMEKATAIPDEDNLTNLGGIKQGLGNFFGKKWLGENMALQAYIDVMKDKQNINLTKAAIRSLKTWEQGYEENPNPVHKEHIKAKIPYVINVMKRYIIRQASWEIENTRYKDEKHHRLEEANVPNPPDVKQAESDLRNDMDILARKLKASFRPDFMGNTARILTPITYRGSNKIIAVLGIKDNYDNENYEYGKTPSQTIIEYYGSVTDSRFADHFAKEMERFGDWDVAGKKKTA